MGPADGAARDGRAVPAAGPVPAPPPPAVRSLADRLAQAFRAETPRLLAELGEAIELHDFARAARIAHNIKGSAFYIRSDTMADDAGGLEDACDAHDERAIERHWPALRASIDDWMGASTPDAVDS